MGITRTRGHIILLFIISSFLFPHSSSAAAGFSLKNLIASFSEKQLQRIRDSFSMSNVVDIYSYYKKYTSDEERSNNLTPKLRTALENFQTTYGLPVTGKFDDATVSLINRPQCGVSDDGNVSSLRWPWPEEKKELTYAYYNGDKVTAPLRAVFSRAFGRWENVTGMSFNETASFDGSDIGIVFLRWNETEVVAVSSFGKTRRGMFFDVDEEWGPLAGDTAAGEVDLETAVMHQIGHVVGLGHTTIDEAAVMFPFMVRGKRNLDFGTNETVRIQQVFNITSNAGTSTGGSTLSTGSSGGTSGSDGGSVGPVGWVLSLGIALLSLCL